MRHASPAHQRLTKALTTNLQRKGPLPMKARKMLRDGTVHGQPLSRKQRGLFGAIVGRSR